MGRAARVKWLDRDIIRGPYLTLCTTPEQFDAVNAYLGIDDAPEFQKTDHSDATLHTMEHEQHGLCCVLCLGSTEGRTPIEIAGLLVHEAVHVWQKFSAYIGEDAPSKEFEAYSIQTIAQTLMAAYAATLEA